MTKNLLLIACTLVTFARCSKKDDDEPVNWAEKLKGTTWAGEYKSTGLYIADFPFSIFFTENTFDWHTLDGTFLGTWQVVENHKLTLTFNGGAVVTADVGNNSWSNFGTPSVAKWPVLSANFVKDIPRAEQLQNTTWKGTLQTQEFKIEFLPGNKLRTITSNGTSTSVDYTVSGAGIAWSSANPEERAYGTFTSNTSISGFRRTYNGFVYVYNRWTVSK